MAADWQDIHPCREPLWALARYRQRVSITS